jgi:hypothetical protein
LHPLRNGGSGTADDGAVRYSDVVRDYRNRNAEERCRQRERPRESTVHLILQLPAILQVAGLLNWRMTGNCEEKMNRLTSRPGGVISITVCYLNNTSHRAL